MKILSGAAIVIFVFIFFIFSGKEQDLNNDFSNVNQEDIYKVQLRTGKETEDGIIEKEKQSEYTLQDYGITKDGTIIMDDDYFGYLYYEIEKNPCTYDSRQIVITGFVYKETESDDNEFKVARIQLPKCGSEENQMVGLMCATEKAPDFSNGEWITVKGTLVVESYINPMTNTEHFRYHIEPESIERIQRNSDCII